MYRELFPLRQALSAELKANLPPAVPGIDSEHLLQSYLDRLTMYVGCDVADQILTFFAVDTAGDELDHLSAANDPQGFEQIWDWLENLRSQHGLRIILLAMESTGVYYWACWDFLTQRPNLARVLYNPRTTEHMTEVLSKKVRNELVDAYALAEQVRLGSTPEVVLSEDADLLTARFCSRAARDLGQGWKVSPSVLIEAGETCDPPDVGNGCDELCEAESGYVCPLPGVCYLIPVCGNGILQIGEECDVGPTSSPGCDSTNRSRWSP